MDAQHKGSSSLALPRKKMVWYPITVRKNGLLGLSSYWKCKYNYVLLYDSQIALLILTHYQSCHR